MSGHYGACPLTKGFRLRNDLYCVEWGVKLYSLTHVNEGVHLNILSLWQNRHCSQLRSQTH